MLFTMFYFVVSTFIILLFILLFLQILVLVLPLGKVVANPLSGDMPFSTARFTLK